MPIASNGKDPYQTRLYVIANGTFSKKNQYVQGAHAVAQYCLDHDDWANGYLIMLKKRNLQELIDKLDKAEVEYAFFKDSHYGDKITAIAATDIGGHVEDLKLI